MAPKTVVHKALDALNGNQKLLEEIETVLERHGVDGMGIGRIGLTSKRGAVPMCPNGQPAVFRCVATPNGEVECKWVCE